MFKDGVSDHAPVRVRLPPRMPKPSGQRSISKFVVQSEPFRRLHQIFVDKIGLDRLPPILRWATHKIIIQEAARRARDAL
eukprot:11921873-Heterocapsa_arctica.AAC.1